MNQRDRQLALSAWYEKLERQAQSGLNSAITENSAYLKEVCCDVLSVISTHRGLEGPLEQREMYRWYVDRVVEEAYPLGESSRATFRNLIEQIHPLRLRPLRWSHIAQMVVLIEEGRRLQLDQQFSDLGMYTSYFFAIHPNKGWVTSRFIRQHKETMKEIVDPIRFDVARSANRLRSAHALVARRLISYVESAYGTYSLEEIYDQIVVVMTILHLFHMGARCDQFETSPSREQFAALSECLTSFVNFLISEILL